jgi:hypothetical protein
VRTPHSAVAAGSAVAEVDVSACSTEAARRTRSSAARSVASNGDNDRVATPRKAAVSAVAADASADAEAGTIATAETDRVGVTARAAMAAVSTCVGVTTEAFAEASRQRITSRAGGSAAVAAI